MTASVPAGSRAEVDHEVQPLGGNAVRKDLGTQAMRRLIAETFPGARVTVEAHGNVLAAVASLHGLSAEELSHAELDHRDPNYEVLLTGRAEKAS